MNSRLLLLTLLLLSPALVWAQSDCAAQARTDLESLFCQIKPSSQGSKLPSFFDFRKNTPQVQRSLLRGPARALGLALPDKAASSSQAQRTTTAPVARKPVEAKPSNTVAAPVNDVVTVSLGPPPVAAKAPPQPAPKQSALAECRLDEQHIQCPARRYLLKHNEKNALLRPGALESGNVLAMKDYRGDLGNESAVQDYLLESYRLYIEKMLAIGLGGATMSYTKFYYTYWELIEKQENFAQRFAQMYEYLKKDKTSLAVKARYHDNLPKGLSQCGALSEQLVVCDDGATNWVYLAP